MTTLELHDFPKHRKSTSPKRRRAPTTEAPTKLPGGNRCSDHGDSAIATELAKLFEDEARPQSILPSPMLEKAAPIEPLFARFRRALDDVTRPGFAAKHLITGWRVIGGLVVVTRQTQLTNWDLSRFAFAAAQAGCALSVLFENGQTAFETGDPDDVVTARGEHTLQQ